MSATATVLLALLLATPANPPATSYPFVETFDAGAAQRWHVFAGDWQFETGAVRQTAGDYDCGATVDVRPDGPFYLSISYQPEAFNGGGLLFALPGTDRKNGGMMVRCDPGGRILWGWFNDGGTFEYLADTYFDGTGNTPQQLAVAVDPDKLAFNIFHNGQRIATNVRTFHTVGFVGMQTSGGAHTVTRFEVRPATADELAGIKPPGKYSRIIDVIGDAEKIIALRRAPEFLAAFNADGEPCGQATVEDLAGAPAEDLQPVALAWENHAPVDGKFGFLVLANRGTAIYRFDQELHQVGDAPFVLAPDMCGMALAVGPTGHIFVVDAAIPGIRVFDAQGKQCLAYGQRGSVACLTEPTPEAAGRFTEPRGIAISPDGQIVITDRECCTYTVYRYDPNKNTFTWLLTGPWVANPTQVLFDHQGRMLMSGTYEYYAAYGALRVMTIDGISQRVFLGHTLGDMSDRTRVCQGPGDDYYLFDSDRERILIVPPDFVEPMPQFAWLPDGGVQLTTTRVDGTPIRVTSNDRTNDGRVIIRQQEPICRTWPPTTPEDLLTYELPPKPPAGQTYVIDMPVLVVVITKMVNDRGEEVAIDPTGVVERLQRELVRDRTFYWQSSHCLLNKQFEFMVIDEVVPQNVGGWVTPDEGRRIVNAVRTQRGLRPVDATHSLCVIHPMAGFDATITDDPGFVSGGGLTNPAYSGYALWNHGQGWLMGHEWGHQLDSYFDMSGMHDWWLNHPDGTVHLGCYGEHWDCNAFLCRRVDRMNWLRFRYGHLRLTDDRDGDGLPDNDPTLPMDEARFGSDSSKPDTDGDGLSDLDELVAGTFTSSDPTSTDTDGDGTPDGQDAHPQYAVADTLKRTTLTPAGILPPDAYQLIGRLNRDWCEAAVFGAYDADNLYLMIALMKPARQVLATVDFDHNGWFIGHDNVTTHVDIDWPRDRAAGAEPRILRANGCTAELFPTGFPASPEALQYAAPSLVIRIPRPAARAPLAPGSEIGLTIRFQNGGGTLAFLLDPWQILGLTLE